MVFSKTSTVLAAAALASIGLAQDSSSGLPSFSKQFTTPTVTLPANALVEMGCYATGTPLISYGRYGFQSSGNCQLLCLQENKPVMALANGNECACADLLPPSSYRTDNSSCDTTCGGGEQLLCGGPNMYWVELTGSTRNRIQEYKPDHSSSSSATAATQTPSTAPSPTTSSISEDDDKSNGPNKAGIAAGVIVGVVALAGIIGAVVFLLRQKRRREVEDEYRRQANINAFTSGGKVHSSSASMTDSRLDPEFMNRRQSNGSIADNEDYSRRILQVTNA